MSHSISQSNISTTEAFRVQHRI